VIVRLDVVHGHQIDRRCVVCEGATRGFAWTADEDGDWVCGPCVALLEMRAAAAGFGDKLAQLETGEEA
jgi:hypothetical protein